MSRRCIASITLVDLYQEKNTSWVWVAFLKSGDSIEILVQIHKLVACNFYLFFAIVDFIGMILKNCQPVINGMAYLWVIIWM